MNRPRLYRNPGGGAPIAGSVILLLFVLWAIWTALS